MKIRRRYVVLILLFFVYFGIRLIFSLQTDYFLSDSSYFALRQIEHIKETGMPLVQDQLSYGGRTFVFLPFYYYLLALFSIIGPEILIIKIVNNLLASTIIIAVYLVCKKVLRNRKISIIIATVSALIPIYINETLNDINPYSLIIPGGFFLIYLFLKLDKEKNMINFLVPLTLVLTLTSSSISLILLGLAILLLLRYIEKVPSEKIELEYIAFFTFFFLWTNFLIYKSAFQLHGFSIIWKNTPPQILGRYFTSINIFQGLTSIGFLPFIFGIFTVYAYLFRKKSKHMLVFISLFLATLILFWLRTIRSELALIYMGASLVILFGQFLRDFFSSIKKTKFASYKNAIYVAVILLLIFTQVLPGLLRMSEIVNNSPKKMYIQGFMWLQNTPKDSVILSGPGEGHLVTYFGKRKNVVDTNYLLIEDAEVIVADVRNIYTQKFKIEAIRLMEKYDIDYIVLSDKIKKEYGIQTPDYLSSDCFELKYNETIQIYKRDTQCELRKL